MQCWGPGACRTGKINGTTPPMRCGARGHGSVVQGNLRIHRHFDHRYVL